MRGTKPDEFIREPFPWNEEKYTTFWMNLKYNTRDSIADVKAQSDNPSSLLNHYKKLVAFRNSSKPLTFGSVEPIAVGQPKILGFKRLFDGEQVLILINISNSGIALDLLNGMESFSKVKFSDEEAKVFENRKALLPAYSTLILSKN